MTRQNIAIGTVAMGAGGDELRPAAIKINTNFVELYQKLGGDSNTLSTGISLTNSQIVFEGSSADSFETYLSVIDPTADRTIQFPNYTGSVVLDSNSQTLKNKTLITPTLTTPKFNDLSSNNLFSLVTPELTGNVNINFPLLLDSDTITFNSHTQTLTNKSLTSPVLTTPKIITRITDTNGAEIIGITPIASSVSSIIVANAATGNNPSIGINSTDSDASIAITGKNGGGIELSKLIYTMSTVTTNGATPKNATFIDCNKGTALALSLSNGVYAGEVKKYANRGAGTVTVTPTSFAGGTSFALAQNESCEVIWNGINWFLSSNQSVVTIV